MSQETAKAITDVTKIHLKELAEAHQAFHIPQKQEDANINEEYLVKSLEKLSLTMSDRAANEKLADKPLTDLRDSMLEKCRNEKEVGSVKHFHCMPHVLLGFHRYVLDVEKEIVEVDGPLGRDSFLF